MIKSKSSFIWHVWSMVLESDSLVARPPSITNELYSIFPSFSSLMRNLGLSRPCCCCCCIVAKSCPTLCNRMDCSPPGSCVHGISQEEYWSGLPFHPSGDHPDPRIEPRSPAVAVRFSTAEPPL